MWWGIPDMCRDCRHLTVCQNQYRQNELAGWVDVPTRVEVCVTGDSRHVYWPKMSHHLSKETQTEWTSWSGRCSYQGGGPCDGGSQTCVGTTDVSPPVKKNTDRMNQLVRWTFLPGWRSVWRWIPDICREHRSLTTCQKQYRHNEEAFRVNFSTRVEIGVMGDPRHM